MHRSVALSIVTAAAVAGAGAPAAATAATSPAPPAVTAAVHDRTSFDATLAAHLRAIQRRDIARYAATVHPQAQLILPNAAVVSGKREVVEVNREFFADPTWTLAATELSRGVTERAATVVFRFAFTYTEPDGSQVVSTNVVGLTFVRDNGRWLMLHDQNTRVPAA
jgi:uncharacterized protein (TIGR02246 family)